MKPPAAPPAPQTQIDLRAEERKTILMLVLGAVVGVVALAVHRVDTTMPHLPWRSVAWHTIWLLISWSSPAAELGWAILMIRWERRQRPAWKQAGAHRHLLPEYPHREGDEVALGKRIEQRLAHGLRVLYAKNPFYPLFAIFGVAILIDGGFMQLATDHPAIAKPIDMIEVPITLFVIAAGAVYSKRSITSGGAKRAPRSVAALARRLQPPETGALVLPHDVGLPAPSEKAPAVAVIGPAGTGKTHLLASDVATWPGKKLAASTKYDLALYAATSMALQADHIGADLRQSVQIYDPAGRLADHWARRDWDPSVVPTGADAEHHAKEMARVMAEELQSGQSGSFWSLRAEPIIAAILALAALPGYDLTSLVAGLLQAGPQALVNLLTQGSAKLGQAGDTANANVLAGLAASMVNNATHRRAYDELASAMAALQPLLRIHGNATATAGRLPKLDLGAWARSESGLAGIFLPPEMGKALGPLVAAFIQSAIAQVRDTQGSARWPTLIVLDEVANLADLPMLGTWAAELRGWGAYLVVAAQSSEQFRKWDQHDPTAFITHHFPLTVVAEGAAEQKLAELVSARHGTHIVTQDSQSANPWRERVPVIPPEQVFGRYKGPGNWVCVFNGHKAGHYSLKPVDTLLDQLQSAVEQRKQREALRKQRAELKGSKRLALKRGVLP